MPWEQSLPMDQKTQFVAEYLRDTISFTELCDRYGISRKTGCPQLTLPTPFCHSACRSPFRSCLSHAEHLTG
jgi:hypothetical protein